MRQRFVFVLLAMVAASLSCGQERTATLYGIVTDQCRGDVGTNLYRGRSYEFGFFAQDDWRIKPNLLQNPGVRYRRNFHGLNSIYNGLRGQAVQPRIQHSEFLYPSKKLEYESFNDGIGGYAASLPTNFFLTRGPADQNTPQPCK
jgi:hypothetical protein